MSDAGLSMPAARMPITAYAVLTGSAAPKLLTNPPLALIWLASHCAPRCARCDGCVCGRGVGAAGECAAAARCS